MGSLCKYSLISFHTFVDVDECSNNYHSCSHHCNNLPGGYNCYCNDGYYLLSNGNECQGKLYMYVYLYVPFIYNGKFLARKTL